ncbi:MAG: hypothetical protein ACI396_00070 [Acutalibacteraceae bacterium]
MKLFKFLEEYKWHFSLRPFTLLLVLIFALTVVWNCSFNVTLHRKDEDGWINTHYSSDYEDNSVYEISDISLSGTTVKQMFNVQEGHFNSIAFCTEENGAPNVDESAKFLLEITDSNNNVVYSKKGKARDVFQTIYTHDKYFEPSVYTVTIKPLTVGKASPLLLSTFYMSDEEAEFLGASLYFDGKFIKNRGLDMIVNEVGLTTGFGFYNPYLALLCPLSLMLLIAWLIYCRISRKKQTE